MITNSRLIDFKGWLHSDMLLQEQLVPNNVNVRWVLSRSCPAFHLMEFRGKLESHVCIEDTYATASLESIYKWLQGMGYRDISYCTKMLQGPFSRSCGFYAFYFLVMRSWGVPLGAITSAFREYDFAYNEVQIRLLLGWHIHVHIYTVKATMGCH